MYKCENCGREFETSQALGGHVVSCIYKVRRKIGLEKIKQYNLNPNLCELCGNPIFHKEGRLADTKRKKFCSHSCSAKIGNVGRKRIRQDKFCIYCGKLHKRENAKYCSQECVNKVKGENCWNKVKKGEAVKPDIVKRYLIKERGVECENCHLTEWLSGPIPLEIHHINGNCLDHRKENLLLICPNCHTLTDNYKSKNKNSKRKRW